MVIFVEHEIQLTSVKLPMARFHYIESEPSVSVDLGQSATVAANAMSAGIHRTAVVSDRRPWGLGIGPLQGWRGEVRGCR